MLLAFVADDHNHHVGAVLTQLPDGSLTAKITGDAPADAAEAQVRRILSIDTGQLDAAALRAMSHEAAVADLQRINGLGPVYATLVYCERSHDR